MLSADITVLSFSPWHSAGSELPMEDKQLIFALAKLQNRKVIS